MTWSYLRLSLPRTLAIGLIVGITSCPAARPQSATLAVSFHDGGLNFSAPEMPFQAEGTVQITRKLLDGNTILVKKHVVWGRDAGGRFVCSSESIPDGLQYVIIDPVAMRTFNWGTHSKTVLSQKLAEGRHVKISPIPLGQDASSHIPVDQKQVTIRTLGKRTIGGIETEGLQVLTTIAAGAIGNQNPIVIVHEEWFSAELQFVLAESDQNPLSGDRKSEITSITRTNPRPELFQLPQGLPVQQMPTLLGPNRAVTMPHP